MADARQNFLMRFGVLELIIGSFAFLTVPLLAASFFASEEQLATVKFIATLYFVCFGASHFFVTFAVYFDRDNLRFFLSDPKHIVLYFVLPACIMAVVFSIYQFQPWNTWALVIPFALPLFELTIRAADFLHVQRQSYGVLQLLKGSTGIKFSAISKTLEKLFFPLMATAGWLTFAKTFRGNPDKRLHPFVDSPYFRVLENEWLFWGILTVAISIFLIAVWNLVQARGREGTLKQRYSPAVYFLLQSSAVTMAVINTNLYVLGLAMHYVEYHVLVFQRSFKAGGSMFRSEKRTTAGRVGTIIAFLAVLVGVTWLFAYVPKFASANGSPVTMSMNNMFLTVIVFHFYIDALIWRFRQPFYRETLGPVYFAPK